MKKSVLIVEADNQLRHHMMSTLSEAAHVVAVTTAAEAERELYKNNFSLLILDVDLPDANGIDLCASLRQQDEFYDLPIFFLTNRSDLDNKLKGFEAGADDYLVKPIDTAELKARVMSYFRRRHSSQKQLLVDFYRVDFTQHRIFEKEDGSEERDLEVTPLEFKLFSHFLKSPGRVIPRTELLNLFWRGNVQLSKNTLETHISSLRKKMGVRGHLIKSVFKKGYCYSPLNVRRGQTPVGNKLPSEKHSTHHQ